MRPLAVGVLQWASVLLVGVSGTPFPGHLARLSPLARLDKRAVVFDATCDTNYDGVTAKSLILSSMDLAPKMAQAGYDALGKVVQVLQKSAPTWAPGEQDRVLKTYTSLFGKPSSSTSNDHISRIGLIRSGLQNLAATSSQNPPGIIIHCDDSWILSTAPEGTPGHPPGGDPTKLWGYDSDRNEWKQWSSKPCADGNAAVTTINEDTDTRPERITFCPAFFNIQKDNKPMIWDMDPKNVPETYVDGQGQTQKFNIAAFGRKFGRIYTHEFMHLHAFNNKRNQFKDQRLQSGEKAYTFVKANQLSKENQGLAATNIENIVYWCIAMYFNGYNWSTGTPEPLSA